MGAGDAESKTVHRKDLHIRDPFVVPAPEEGVYYLYGTLFPLPDGPGFPVYESKDLETWSEPRAAFRRFDGFWADRNFWAPEVHVYRERYFMFASFKAKGVCRGTQILVADTPRGPFQLYSDRPVTPRDWECLDGTLHIDGYGQPWIVFCHEWVQVGDGEMCAVRLTEDLKAARGEPVLLFRASDPAWGPKRSDKPIQAVTDGPFLYRAGNDDLVMFWSSFWKGKYVVAVARSRSGDITGPWTHDPEPLYTNDGGHPMVFRDFDGRLRLSLHQPNRNSQERPVFLYLHDKDGQFTCAAEPKPE
jgi:beta-xylosidase